VVYALRDEHVAHIVADAIAHTVEAHSKGTPPPTPKPL
jgi:hypothetical protein